MIRSIALAIAVLALSFPLRAETTLRIAVASNFQETLAHIAQAYRKTHPETTITLIPGSSGKLYAQIAHGAPFDAFFSADADRPLALEQNEHAAADTRFTFALGILALWRPGSDEPDIAQARTIALANPKLAPFGRAAEEVLSALQIPRDTPRRITGNSVSHAFNFAQSGAADTALVSYSQLLQQNITPTEYHILDTALYGPIEQQAIALSDNSETRAFLRFCQSEIARDLIRHAGYHLPEEPSP